MEPGFEALVRDEVAMCIWEVVSRSDRGMGVARLAELTEISVEAAQRQLDRLERHGLVRSVRGRVGMVHVARELAEIHPDAQALMLDGTRDLRRSRTRQRLKAHLDGQSSGATDDLGFGMSVRLGPSELAEVRRRIEDLRRFLTLTQQSGRSGRGRKAESSVQSTHHVTAHVLPVPGGELPLPEGRLGDGRPRGSSRPLEGLSPREREVAMALLAGQTMRQVAASLGLSFYTVDTLVRRVYRKLDVKRRTEFIMRMRDAERA